MVATPSIPEWNQAFRNSRQADNCIASTLMFSTALLLKFQEILSLVDESERSSADPQITVLVVDGYTARLIGYDYENPNTTGCGVHSGMSKGLRNANVVHNLMSKGLYEFV